MSLLLPGTRWWQSLSSLFKCQQTSYIVIACLLACPGCGTWMEVLFHGDADMRAWVQTQLLPWLKVPGTWETIATHFWEGFVWKGLKWMTGMEFSDHEPFKKSNLVGFFVFVVVSPMSLWFTTVSSLKPGYFYRLCQQVRTESSWDTEWRLCMWLIRMSWIEASMSYNKDKKSFSWAQFQPNASTPSNTGARGCLPHLRTTGELESGRSHWGWEFPCYIL